MVLTLNPQMLFSSPLGYLAPSAVICIMLLFQRGKWAPVILLRFTGVLVHEVLHFIVGLVTMARPSSMTLIPKAEAGRLVLGSVGFLGLNWLNAWITALAPLLALPLIYGVASWRLTYGPPHFQWGDLLIWLLIAPQGLNCWPSRADWKLVLISWPLMGVIFFGSLVWLWAHS